MSLARVACVERNGPGASLVLDVQGVDDIVVAPLNEEQTARLALRLLDQLDQRAREQVLAKAQQALDAFATERVESLLRTQADTA